MFCCGGNRIEPDRRPKGVLSKDDFVELGKVLAEAAVLQLKGITKADLNRLAKEFRVVIKKVKRHDKQWYKQANKAVNTFMKNGNTEGILDCIKTFKETYA